jgi:transcriptional regulator with PAS, ATPase and Fis domain
VRSPGASHCLTDIIGRSAAIEKARRLALRAGQSDLPILIIGETGTGKELFAHAMHQVSGQARGPFIPINCAAIPESLIEAELFGHEQGAFTGARRQGRASLFERANGGTLFLDELADLSPHAQTALLRVLDEGLVTRVGGGRAIAVDVRVIAAVNQPLEDLIIKGAFRRDLYHRLCGFPLWIPPLRERRQDIPLLAHHFLKGLDDRQLLTGEVMDYLLSYRWPGNVRELQQCLKYMVTVSDDALTVADLPPHIQPYVQINNTDRERNSWVLKTTLANPDGLVTETKYDFPSLLDEGCSAILTLVENANRTGAGIGRRALRYTAHQEGLILTERAIRKRLRALRADGLIEWGIGRTGVRLTALGRSTRRQMDKSIGVPLQYT